MTYLHDVYVVVGVVVAVVVVVVVVVYGVVAIVVVGIVARVRPAVSLRCYVVRQTAGEWSGAIHTSVEVGVLLYTATGIDVGGE